MQQVKKKAKNENRRILNTQKKGLFAVVIALVCDGYHDTYSEFIVSKFRPDSSESLLFKNMFGSVFLLAYLLALDFENFSYALQFCISNPLFFTKPSATGRNLTGGGFW